jgi:hypothetical protein
MAPSFSIDNYDPEDLEVSIGEPGPLPIRVEDRARGAVIELSEEGARALIGLLDQAVRALDPPIPAGAESAVILRLEHYRDAPGRKA